jgi:hypothetical protein
MLLKVINRQMPLNLSFCPLICCFMDFCKGVPLNHGCTTQISWRAKKIFDTSKVQSCNVLTHSKSVYIKERSNIWGFRGQIKCFYGPHLARGPYVVMPALNQLYPVHSHQFFNGFITSEQFPIISQKNITTVDTFEIFQFLMSYRPEADFVCFFIM